MAMDQSSSPMSAPSPGPLSPTSSTTKGSRRRHWQVLRNALLRKKSSGTDSTSEMGLNFFQEMISSFLTSTPAATTITTTTTSSSSSTKNSLFQWNKYTFINSNKCCFYLYEKKKEQENCIENIQQELFSHHLNQGIDNTGNIRTWPSEQILLKYLIQYIDSQFISNTRQQQIKVCELGAGMAGLGAFGLLAYYNRQSSSLQMDMLITDGNRKAVDNLKLCLQENMDNQHTINCYTNSNVQVNLLRWDQKDIVKTNYFQQFDLIFASDCLFFEKFHMDLLSTIHGLLKKPNGKCFLLQPSRGGSMERFLDKLIDNKENKFNLQFKKIDKYDDEIYQKHVELLIQQQSQTLLPEYRPDVHYPILLEISHINTTIIN